MKTTDNNEQNIQEDDRYVHTGKPPRTIPLYLAVCIAVACIVFSVLTTFAVYDIYSKPDTGSDKGGTETEAPSQGGAEDLELPDYIKNLIKLDEAFRENSFDGIDDEKMGEAILDAYILSTGDIYAEYMNADEYEDYFTDQNGEFVGIGISIVNSEITVNGYGYRVMEIISVFKDSPALESGVMVGDCIAYVNDGGEMVSVSSLGYTKALDVMLGEAGTEAKFIVLRPEGSDYREVEFSIERRKVTTESVTFRVSETDSRVGIVSITGFDLTTPTQFKNAVNTLRDTHGCEYFVFDLRNNPGGWLDSIESVLTYFLDEGDLIVSTEYAGGYSGASYAGVRSDPKYPELNVTKEEIGMYKELDCIVLTNENTASAAELFTATLRDYSIAEAVGKDTYGKGCMQSIFPLTQYGLDGGLKLTVAMYYSKSKEVYHDIGIKPDHEIDLSEEAKNKNFFLLSEGEDAQLLKAIDIITKSK